MSTLTPKQQRFCEEYVIDLNGTQAAIRAGYSAKTAVKQASRLLTKADVKAAITEARKRISEKLDIDKHWVFRKIVENVNRAMTAVPVLDKDGNSIGEYRYDGHVANQALRMLGEVTELFPSKGVKVESEASSDESTTTITTTTTITHKWARLEAAYLDSDPPADSSAEGPVSGHDS